MKILVLSFFKDFMTALVLHLVVTLFVVFLKNLAPQRKVGCLRGQDNDEAQIINV